MISSIFVSALIFHIVVIETNARNVPSAFLSNDNEVDYVPLNDNVQTDTPLVRSKRNNKNTNRGGILGLEDLDYNMEETPRNKRIVGGYEAEMKDFPYMVQVHLPHGGVCGGSIISEKYVITAKHCFFYKHSPIVPDFLRSGSHDWWDGGNIHYFEKSFLHDTADIAIIEVKEPFVWNTNTSTVDLFNTNETILPGTLANVTGWGYTMENSTDLPDVMRTVELPIVSQKNCEWAYRKIKPIESSHVCAGLGKGGKDACIGDSGGPLVVDGRQVGVVSTGRGCARPISPGIYVSIPYFRDWIEEKTGV